MDPSRRGESPPPDVDMPPARDDLAHLRSLNVRAAPPAPPGALPPAPLPTNRAAVGPQEGDMSAEMYTFHEAIDELQRAEEEVLDNHKAVSDYMHHALLRANHLLAITRDVDYDQDGTYSHDHVTRTIRDYLLKCYKYL